jgi:CRISPR-associated protein Cas1
VLGVTAVSRNYYITKSGRLARQDNTLYFEAATEDGKPTKTPIPVADVDALYLYGEIDLNTRLLNFLAQQKISAHVFNYYGYYAGSYYPREYLNSGFLLVQQVAYYQSKKRRLDVARELIKAAVHGIQRNMAYYQNRGKDLTRWVQAIDVEARAIEGAVDTAELMGIEGRIRHLYYEAFNEIVGDDFPFEKRVKRPPDNPVNAMISFGNSLCYAACLTEIYRTQLNPLISYLHEPGERRFSLALDLSEVFKPILVDRAILKLLNQKMIQLEDFDQDVNYCYLKERGRRVFLKEWDERLNTTIQHRRLNRRVSYQRLIRLECYKLIKHLTGIETYEGFRAWW